VVALAVAPRAGESCSVCCVSLLLPLRFLKFLWLCRCSRRSNKIFSSSCSSPRAFEK
jgi:hypothetical protein